MNDLTSLVFHDNLAGAEQGVARQVFWVDSIGDNRVVDCTNVFERAWHRGRFREIEIEASQFYKGRMFNMVVSLRPLRRRLDVVEGDFDLSPRAVNTLHLIAVYNLIKDEGADVSRF